MYFMTHLKKKSQTEQKIFNNSRYSCLVWYPKVNLSSQGIYHLDGRVNSGILAML